MLKISCTKHKDLSSNENNVIMDFFMNTGTTGTGVSCLESNRNLYCIGIDQKYYEIAKNRIINMK